MKEEAKRWWDSAKGDMQKAHDTFDIEHYDLASFLCQQAVEKGLKALILQKQGKLIKTHDLVLLGKKAGAGTLMLAICKDLGPIYTETRYPDASGTKQDYTKEQSESDLKKARDILTWMKKKTS